MQLLILGKQRTFYRFGQFGRDGMKGGNVFFASSFGRVCEAIARAVQFPMNSDGIESQIAVDDDAGEGNQPVDGRNVRNPYL